MHFTCEQLADHLKHRTPRCVEEVPGLRRLSTTVDKGEVITIYELAEETSVTQGAQVLGYPLSDYNPSYLGREFISPLSLRWPEAGDVVVFDSATHGWHGEMNSSAKLRGVGRPQLYGCGECAGEEFSVTAQFDYWDACLDMWADEPEIDIENYFCNIAVVGRCLQCGLDQTILDMDL